MAEILLSSEKFIKEVTSISDNLAGKFILPSLREAQDIKLTGILGSLLVATLKRMVKDGSINAEENGIYKECVDKCQYFLAYSTVVEVTTKVAYKVNNMGVNRTTDENVQSASQDEVAKLQFYYQSKADSYAYELQGWLLANKDALPELTASCCSRIASNLQSAATCGIWLGGVRGKSINPKCGRR